LQMGWLGAKKIEEFVLGFSWAALRCLSELDDD
jgi:hypothetical protein